MHIMGHVSNAEGMVLAALLLCFDWCWQSPLSQAF